MNYICACNLHQRSSAVCPDLGEGKMIDGVEKIHFAACWGLFDNASCSLSGPWWLLTVPDGSLIAGLPLKALCCCSYPTLHFIYFVSLLSNDRLFEYYREFRTCYWLIAAYWFSYRAQQCKFCSASFIPPQPQDHLDYEKSVKIIIQTINKHALKWVVNKSQYDPFVLIQMSYNFAYNIFLGRIENMPVTGEFNNDKIIRGKFKGKPFCCPSYGALFMHIIFLRYLPTA